MKEKLITLKEAQELILKTSKDFGVEEIELEKSLNRVLAEDIRADRNYPPFNRSAVDGYAIQSNDLGKYEEFIVIDEVYAGGISDKQIIAGTAIKIMTGAPVPDCADCVIKVEDSNTYKKTVTFFIKEIKKGANIALEGEDIKKNEIAVPKSTVCNPQSIGILASLGKHRVKVYKLPKVVIISTGDEIQEIKKEILTYQIRDCNSYTIENFFKLYGISIDKRVIIRDNKLDLTNALIHLEYDILILSGGVSMGDADFVPEVLTNIGITNVFHKVAIKPGKPIWFGVNNKNKGAVFALPGNPFSCQVAFKIFIEPYLRNCLGLPKLKTIQLPLFLSKKKKTSFEEFFPCSISESTSGIIPIKFNGSGDFCSVLYSEGIALHSSDKADLEEGKLVEFYPWKSLI